MPIGMADDVFRALADPTRRTILDELTERDGQTLFEICAQLATKHGLASSRQAVSQHLAVLESAGLIRTRRQSLNRTPTPPYGPTRTRSPRTVFPPRRSRWTTRTRSSAGSVSSVCSSARSPPSSRSRPVTTAVLDDTCGNLIQIHQQK
ncbi:hypothetical protein GCM10010400_11440 [Streptomyces aculeolatus]